MKFDLWSMVLRAPPETPAPTAPAAPPTPEAPAPSPTEPPAPPAPLVGGDPPAGNEPAATPPVPATLEPLDVSKLKLPEGLELAPELATKFGEVATKHGLRPEAAEALLGLHAETIREAAAAPYKVWNDTQTKWQDEIRADPVYGGPKLDASLTKVSKVIDQFGGPEVREALGFTGAGNNPALARFLFKLSDVLVEGGHVQGATPAGPPPKGASAMYPNLKP